MNRRDFLKRAAFIVALGLVAPTVLFRRPAGLLLAGDGIWEYWFEDWKESTDWLPTPIRLVFPD